MALPVARILWSTGLVSGLLLPRSAEAQTSVVGGPAEQPRPRETSVVGTAVVSAEATEADGGRRRVSEIVIEFVRVNPDHPTSADVLEAVVDLTPTRSGYVAARSGGAVERLRLADLAAREAAGSEVWLYDSALAVVAPAIVKRLQALGLVGVYAEPDPEQIRVEGGLVVDARPAGVTTLTYQITTGVVTEVRTIGLGERLPEDETLNNPIHARIASGSPVRPAADSGSAGAGDLLRSDLIDAYVMRLNRHAGRRVDVAVSPGGDVFGGVTLDYLVTENRPWLLFAQVANTGTDSTNQWRERFGFIHNQLTNRDDIFSIEYLTGNFEDVNAVVTSYERPLGLEVLRGRVYGSWYEYTASEVGQPDADFSGDGWSFGGEAAWNFFQHRETFVDLVGGVRWEGVSVDNALADLSGQENMVLAYAALRLERVRASARTFASLTIEGTLDGVDGDEVSTLGRTDADGNWTTLAGSASHSFFIEPLVDPNAEEATSLAHEIALSGRFQSSLEHRLIPNYQQVLGGLYTVRGYPESVVAGDSMWLLSAEYRWHIPRGLTPNPQAGEFMGEPFRYRPQYAYGPVDWDLVLKAFVDVGGTDISSPLSFETDQTLVGAGVGVELAWTRRVNLRLDLGWALEEMDGVSGGTSVDAGDFEAHFVLTLVY